MARPKTNRSPAQLDARANGHIDTEKLDQAHQALIQRSDDLAVIDMRFALDGDYDYARIDSMMPAAMTMNATSALWIGRALMLVKEHEPAGTFGTFLESHGMHPRSAQRYMALARRFGESDQRKLLAGRLGIGKAIELLGESDADLDALAKAGDEDAIFSMSRAEIRAHLAKKDKALAKLEDKLASSEDLLAAKNKKIDELDRTLSGKPNERTQALLTAIDAKAVEAGSALVQMRELITELEAVYEHTGKPMDALVIERVDKNRHFAADWLRTIASDLGE